jgi:hypothetical protein
MHKAVGSAISLTAEYNSELTLLHVMEGIPSWFSIDEATTAAMKQLDELIPPERPKAGTIKTTVRTRRTSRSSSSPWKHEPT